MNAILDAGGRDVLPESSADESEQPEAFYDFPEESETSAEGQADQEAEEAPAEAESVQPPENSPDETEAVPPGDTEPSVEDEGDSGETSDSTDSGRDGVDRRGSLAAFGAQVFGRIRPLLMRLVPSTTWSRVFVGMAGIAGILVILLVLAFMPHGDEQLPVHKNDQEVADNQVDEVAAPNIPAIEKTLGLREVSEWYYPRRGLRVVRVEIGQDSAERVNLITSSINDDAQTLRTQLNGELVFVPVEPGSRYDDTQIVKGFVADFRKITSERETRSENSAPSAAPNSPSEPAPASAHTPSP